MDLLGTNETTPLTQGQQKNETTPRRQSSILKSNNTKYLTLAILVIIALVVAYAATNYHGLARNPTTTPDNKKVSVGETTQQPHIIWIIADDLGQSDISLHGSEIATPNIDSLAENGIELKSHYVMPLCSPSRASFLSGRHSFRLGVQATMSDLIKPQSIAHIPSSYKLAGNYFIDAGYETHAYGKWHAGYSKKSYTPIKRGFNHHTGFYQFAIDYNSKYTLDNQYGYDWFSDGNVDWDSSDESLYTTFILTDKISHDLSEYANGDMSKPLFLYIAFQNPHFLVGVPDDFESNCDNIEDEQRAEYCAHVQALDFAVGTVIDSLKSNGLYENSVIAFTTDNGALSLSLCGNPGSHVAAGSAYPYRGGKYTLFEGGVNTPAFISGNLVPKEYHGTSTNSWFQAADWLPTLLHWTQQGSSSFFDQSESFFSSDESVAYYEPDGYDMYSMLFENGENERQVNDGYLILNIDYKDEYDGYVDTSIIYKGYKMIYNHELYLMGSCDVYSAKPYSTPFSSIVNEDVTSETNFNNMYLFDLDNDPTETTDLLENRGRDSTNYEKYSGIIDEMFTILDKEKEKGFMMQQDKTAQTDGDSTNFDGAWMPWQDENESEFEAAQSTESVMNNYWPEMGKEKQRKNDFRQDKPSDNENESGMRKL